MAEAPNEGAIQVDFAEDDELAVLLARLINHDYYGSGHLAGWLSKAKPSPTELPVYVYSQESFFQPDPTWWFKRCPGSSPKDTWRIDLDGSVHGDVPLRIQGRVELASQFYRDTEGPKHKSFHHVAFCLSWAGVPLMHDVHPTGAYDVWFEHRPKTHDIPVAIRSRLKDAVAEVFSDEDFAEKVLSFCPEIEVVWLD